MRSFRILQPFLIFFIFFIGFSSILSAQSTQRQKNDSVLVLFKQRFNAKNTDSIYSLLGVNSKKTLSPEVFRKLAEQQLFPGGQIKEFSLISFVNNKLSNYILRCDVVTWQLLIRLDKAQKIDSLQFKPYIEKKTLNNKAVPVASSNTLISIADKQIDTIARVYIQKVNTVGLSIGILKNGKVSIYNYGETKQGNGKLPDANSIFEIGSVTKTFTATLLAWYVNKGKINLTDPITKFLPDSVTVNKELQGITLLSLSNHSSGLPKIPDNLFNNADPLNPYKNYNKQLLYAYLKSCKLNSKPGKKYEYSNLAVGLLGTILEQVSGKTFEQMVTAIICKPLGMKSTTQHLTQKLKKSFTTVYNGQGKQTTPWDADALAGCVALRSTINDLLLYAKANMMPGNDKLSRALNLTHQITFNRGIQIGLGWGTFAPDYYYHSGGTYGSKSMIIFNANKHIVVVVLSNAYEDVNDVGVGIIQKLQ